MSMIERLARAMFPELWEPVAGLNQSQIAARAMHRGAAKRAARAALDALMEPDEGMIEAGTASLTGHKHPDPDYAEDVRMMWQAMIRKVKGYTGGHAKDCQYHVDQYDHECTCGLKGE